MRGQPVLIHAVGGGDCGFAAALNFTGRQPDYEGDPGAAGTDRRPLRKIFEGLALAGERLEGIVLIGTTNEHRPGDRPFIAYAQEMAQRLTDPAGLCGRRLGPTCVSTVPVTQPTTTAVGHALSELLRELAPAECLVSCGSGSYSLSVGALLAVIEAGFPVRLVHVDRAHQPYEIATARHGQHHLKRWLVRHRFWDQLAPLDPDHRLVWELLAARQRADCGPAVRLVTSDAQSALPRGKIAKLAEQWPAVQAATFERIGRGEAVDHALLRTWFDERFSRLYGHERERLRAVLPPRALEPLERLASGFEGSGANGYLTAARELPPTGTTDSRVVRTLRDPELMDMYLAARTHAAHLRPDDPRPLPYTIVEAADRFEHDDVARDLVAQTGFTTWPVLGSGDVLVLIGVGLPRDGRDEDDRHALRAVLDHAWTRSGRLLRRGRIRLRLLAGTETTARARALLTWAQPLLDGIGGEADVITSLPVGPDAIDDLRRQVLARLRSGPGPTGMSGSGSLRDVDDILLVLSPGTAAANYGMIAAGIDWALEAACPFTITELARVHGGPPELRTGQSSLCRLGIDGVLAHLAAGALRRLDLRTVIRLLALGSAGLAEALRDVRRFAAETMGPGQFMSVQDRDRHAHARLGLVAHVLGDHPELAAYVAVESVRPALFSFEAWGVLARTDSAARTLTRIRDASPCCHLFDRRRAKRGGRPRPQANVRGLLGQLMTRLQRSDGALIAEYERLLAMLHAHSPYTG